MTPVLLLHGALGSRSQLEPLNDLLSTKGFAVYTMNFSGHSGEAFKATFGIETFAADIVSFLHSNKLAVVDVFGYSMGGYVALWLARMFPDKVRNVVTLGTKFDWTPEEAKKETAKLNADKMLEKVPAFARLLQTRHAPQDWKELLTKTSAMMTALGDNPLLSPATLSEINHKTLILLGDQDDMADRNYSKQVSQMMPNARFQMLHNTPHPIERVNKEELVNLLHQHFD